MCQVNPQFCRKIIICNSALAGVCRTTADNFFSQTITPSDMSVHSANSHRETMSAVGLPIAMLTPSRVSGYDQRTLCSLPDGLDFAIVRVPPVLPEFSGEKPEISSRLSRLGCTYKVLELVLTFWRHNMLSKTPPASKLLRQPLRGIR